jgi:hypothetical protein
MRRDVDDILRYVERHPNIPPIYKELIRMRLVVPPDRNEVEAAKNSWAERQASNLEDPWTEKPDPPGALPQVFVDASSDPPPAPGEGGGPGGGFGPFRKS